MAEVILTAASRTTLIELQRVRQLINITAQRLSTGLKVASALDNPAAFFDAIALTNRAAQLLTVKDGVNTAVGTVGSAVIAIDAMVSLIEQIKGTINAAKGGAVSGGVVTTVTGDVVADSNKKITNEIAGAEDNDSFDITHDGTTTTIVNTNGTKFDDLVATIDGISGLTATVSNGNAIVITAADGRDITIANKVNDLATDLGLATSTNGTVASNDTRRSAETQFDLIRTQIDSLATDSTFLGKNLLKTSPDTLTVSLNETGSSTLTIAGIATNVTALSISAVDASDSFATDAGITAAVAELDAALLTLKSTATTLGTSNDIINTRLEFTDDLINTLEEGAAKLTAADLSEEAANLLALVTRHDLAITALGLTFTNGTIITNLLKLG